MTERPFSEVISARRATPSFDGSPLPDKILSKILQAGIEAPSGYNIQPWRFVVVRDKEQKKRLREKLRWVNLKLKKQVQSLFVVVISMLQLVTV
jgi:nitroreductase